MTTVNTKLTHEQVKTEAEKYGLKQEEIDALTFQIFPSNVHIVAYPGGNARGHAFLNHLVDRGLATPSRS